MNLRRYVLGSCAAAAAVLLMLPILPVGAQIGPNQIDPLPSLSPILNSPSPSPSPSPSQSPSPGGGDGGGGGGGGGQPQPEPQPQPAPSGEVAAGPTASSVQQGGFPLEVPDIPRSPSRTTNRLAEILSPLTERGMPLEQAMIIAAPPFPVAGLVWFSDDWLFPRIGPPPHLHEGTDIFAPMGTPIVASSPGYVAGIGQAALGGNSVWIAADDGTGFFYTHLSAYAEGLQLGTRVDSGTPIGFVGNSGNAATTPPHVHFEIHPPVLDSRGRMIAGGVTTMPDGTARTNTPPTNPKPYLDRWLANAEARAQAVVLQLIERFSKISRQLHFAQRVSQLYSSDITERPQDLVWFSIFEPTLAALGLARQASIAAAISGPGGSTAQSQAELQRLELVRQAVEGPRIRLAALTGQFSESVEQ